ncbi:hypothetical protein CSKR_106209 [Clonorchis sinensis]|uniref:Uncharacterized protein n=1 Tax=Clonorchis sinensis TaxID=79923 RepID=A0A3R7JPW6_CLOSI|nr:hypothetical protein CSKR_106209 [Clonorchis sinensis]
MADASAEDVHRLPLCNILQEVLLCGLLLDDRCVQLTPELDVSDGLIKERLVQLPRHLKRSRTSSISPWIGRNVFSVCISRGVTLHFVGSNHLPMTLVSSSKNTCSSSSKTTTSLPGYSRSTRFCSAVI